LACLEVGLNCDVRRVALLHPIHTRTVLTLIGEARGTGDLLRTVIGVCTALSVEALNETRLALFKSDLDECFTTEL
jgi:hypothetical protein